jgi:uncharacterized protein YcnI
MQVSRWLGRSVAVAAGIAILGLTTATAASAHVSAGPAAQPAGSYVVETLSVPHGCEGSSTTKVRIQIPESVPQVTPTVNPNWDVEKTMVTLEAPIDAGHGETIDERVGEIVYTAKTPLPDGLRDAFELSFKTPDNPGETLYFPTIQTCEVGETAWIEIPADGESGDEPEHPAPAVTLVASDSGDGHGASTTDDDTTEPAASSEQASATTETSGSDSSNTLAIIAIVVGGVAIVISGVALARGRS